MSRSGLGAHVWLFFTAPVPAVIARQVGTGLLREAIAASGRMDLASYGRLLPSQDVVQVGGLGNLIAAPSQDRARRRGATVFLARGNGARRSLIGRSGARQTLVPEHHVDRIDDPGGAGAILWGGDFDQESRNLAPSGGPAAGS